MKVQAESFHLNGHIIGFRPQTQKLELPHKTLSNTLAVKGLSMRGMLLGYSFEPRPNSLALATAGSVMAIGLSTNGCSHSKKPVWREKTRLTSAEVHAAASSKV